MSEVRPSPEVPPDWESLARAASLADAEDAAVQDERQVLSFELDGSPYAIPVERVREIVRMRPVTPIPRVSPDVRGVVSLRGEIVEVIDLRRRLGLETSEPTRRSRIIVTQSEEGEVAAFLVDAVREVVTLSEEAIRPAVGSESGSVEGLCALGDRFVSMLNLDRVLAIDV